MRRTIILAGASLAVFASSAATASETINYSYDARGRLVQVAHTGSVNNGVTTAYAFDKADNRVNKATTGAAHISFVGSAAGLVGGADLTVPFSSLKDSNNATPTLQPGDLVVVSLCRRATSSTSPVIGSPTGYSPVYSNVYANGSTDDTNLISYYKFMGATPDTSVTITTTGVSNTQAYVVEVYRGVDQTTPFDGVAPASATALGIASPDAPAITPSSPGAWVVAVGGAVGATGGTTTTALTNPSNMSTATNQFATGTNDRAEVGMTLKTDWASGAFDPGGFGGGSTGSQGSVAAASFVLKPASSP
jgi:YD repeat-containing protein